MFTTTAARRQGNRVTSIWVSHSQLEVFFMYLLKSKCYEETTSPYIVLRNVKDQKEGATFFYYWLVLYSVGFAFAIRAAIYPHCAHFNIQKKTEMFIL